MGITVATTPVELNAIATVWDEMTIACPHASRSLSTPVRKTSDDGVQPHVTLLQPAGRQPILVVGRVGYRALFSVPVRWLVVVAGGVVGARSAADYDLVMTSRCGSLRRGDADILELSKFEVDGLLHRSARGHLAWFQRGHPPMVQKRHRFDLSQGFDAFLAAFFLFETAFDQSFAADEPGTILLAWVLEELAADPEVDSFNFGFGDAQYKRSLSDACWDKVDVVGFAARPRAVLVNALSTAVGLSVSTTKHLLGSDRVAKLRRRRRAELTTMTPAGGDVA